MNNRCMLWSLREHVYMNIGYKNGLPHQTTVAALLSMWTQGGEEEKVKSRPMNAKHLLLTCKLHSPSTPLLITLKCTLNISRAEGVHYRCALTPFVWEVHSNEGCTVQYSIRFYASLSVYKIIPQVCEHFKVSARGHVRKRQRSPIRPHQ